MMIDKRKNTGHVYSMESYTNQTDIIICLSLLWNNPLYFILSLVFYPPWLVVIYCHVRMVNPVLSNPLYRYTLKLYLSGLGQLELDIQMCRKKTKMKKREQTSSSGIKKAKKPKLQKNNVLTFQICRVNYRSICLRMGWRLWSPTKHMVCTMYPDII